MNKGINLPLGYIFLLFLYENVYETKKTMMLQMQTAIQTFELFLYANVKNPRKYSKVNNTTFLSFEYNVLNIF